MMEYWVKGQQSDIPMFHYSSPNIPLFRHSMIPLPQFKLHKTLADYRREFSLSVEAKYPPEP